MKSLSTGTMNCDDRDSFSGSIEDEDAEYRPILSGIISTRCNYDGSKIEASSDY